MKTEKFKAISCEKDDTLLEWLRTLKNSRIIMQSDIEK
jgi:hypothetical protein